LAGSSGSITVSSHGNERKFCDFFNVKQLLPEGDPHNQHGEGKRVSKPESIKTTRVM